MAIGPGRCSDSRPSAATPLALPHLEEAYWFAEGVLPILRTKGVAN